MTMESWQEDNNRYLAASLRWLRLRLQRLAPQEPQADADSAQSGETGAAKPPSPGWRSRWFGTGSHESNERKLLTAARPTALDDSLREAARVREAAAQVDPPPALVVLAQRLGLSPFERDTLLLCVAVEFDPAMAFLYARIQGSAARNYPTFGLALSALDDPAWEALSAHRPLRYLRLVEINQPGATPLTSSPLRADERVVDFIKGLNLIDDRLSTLLTTVGGEEEGSLAESQQSAVETILQRLQDALKDSVVPVVQLLGNDGGSKLEVARQACARLGRRLYRIGSDALPPQPAEGETLSRLWQRESSLLPVALYVDAESLDEASPETKSAFHRFLSKETGLAFVGVRDGPVRIGAASFPAEVNKSSATEQCEAWGSLLSTLVGESESSRTAQMLAGQFNLNFHEIRQVAAAALKTPAEQGTIRERLWDACCGLTRPRLDSLAQRLEVKAKWDDLVLPAEQMGLLRSIASQVRERHRVYGEWGFGLKMNRGFGITALFTGESGTGKTMAAEVIAGELRLNLYRIDLSAVVSKYIGETPKNLRKLFDAAEQGGAILFFDEADALFGKRSEVKDSHDRYANIEINYLLQRMEAFGGLAILATNMKSALDPAFMRRLRFKVNFQFPGVKERKLIWQKVLPAQTPKEALDYDRLARLNITGGNTHSIALNAAFLAAQAGKPVSMPILFEAARTELRKLDKPINEAEFRQLEAAPGKL